MRLAPEVLATFASDVMRTFGAAGAFAAPGDARALDSMRDRVRAVLAEARPHRDGPSLEQALAELLVDARRGWPDRRASARRFAELSALFEQAAFRRTKRAERGRLLAELVVLFELEPAVGLEPQIDAEGDAEAQLKRVRRRLSRAKRA